MTHVLPEPSPRRRWPWSSKTTRAKDVAIGIVLFLTEVAVYVGKSFGDGMEVWAAQGDEARIEAARLASLAWTEHCLVVILVLAGLAALARAPWTVLLQLLAAGAVAALLVLAQHDYDRTHPRPAPIPSAGYSPCYSGSGRCN
ncbi:DUF6234 family protein [Streptomyces sp. NPDC060031]|uniref:DUF6234 family protein n=1 Tax=Streptomyces sp. NPDC060031 TaxID=3347043 RepID=UPI0036893058